MELISIREYGRRKGVPESTIRKAIDQGQIKKGYIKSDSGKMKISELVADEEWFVFYEARTKGRTRRKVEAEEESADVDNTGETGKRRKKNTDNINELQYEIEQVKLETAQIQLEKLKGSVVSKDEVYAALFTAGQEVKATFQALPDRVIDNILAAASRNEAHQVLTDAINEALKTLSEVVERDITAAA